MIAGTPRANGVALGEVTYRAIAGGTLEAKIAYVDTQDGTTLGYAHLSSTTLLEQQDVREALQAFTEALERAAAQVLLATPAPAKPAPRGILENLKR